jgi:hypothetical protein
MGHVSIEATACRWRRIAVAAVVGAAFLVSSCGNGFSDGRPIADAGPDQTVAAGTLVTVDGFRSRPFYYGANLVYVWTMISRPNGSLAGFLDFINNAGQFIVEFETDTMSSTFVTDVAGSYVLGLVVIENTKDGTILSKQDTITITATSP